MWISVAVMLSLVSFQSLRKHYIYYSCISSNYGCSKNVIVSLISKCIFFAKSVPSENVGPANTPLPKKFAFANVPL